MKTLVPNPAGPPLPITADAARLICEAGLKFEGAMALTLQRSYGVSVVSRAVFVGICLLERDGEER